MEILKNFRAWLTFAPVLANEDIRKYDFSKLDLEEEKRKYIESVKKYEPKEDIQKIKKELEKIKTWEELKNERF